MGILVHTGKSTFNLTFGFDAMLPIEESEQIVRRQIQDMNFNDECLRIDLDFSTRVER